MGGVDQEKLCERADLKQAIHYVDVSARDNRQGSIAVLNRSLPPVVLATPNMGVHSSRHGSGHSQDHQVPQRKLYTMFKHTGYTSSQSRRNHVGKLYTAQSQRTQQFY